MKIQSLKYFFIAAVVVGVVACKDDDDKKDGPEGKNKTALNDFAYSNNAEVDMGQLANTKGTSAGVKAFAQMMVMDHQKAQNDLDTIADNRNIDLASDLKTMDKATRDSIDKFTSARFDSAYIKSQIVAHTRTKNMFTAFRDSSTDASLKAYVNRYLPKVQQHLQKADSIFTVIRNAPK